MTDNIELPPLPALPEPERDWDEGCCMYVSGTKFSGFQLFEYAEHYARAAILAYEVTRALAAKNGWRLGEGRG